MLVVSATFQRLHTTVNQQICHQRAKNEGIDTAVISSNRCSAALMAPLSRFESLALIIVYHSIASCRCSNHMATDELEEKMSLMSPVTLKACCNPLLTVCVQYNYNLLTVGVRILWVKWLQGVRKREEEEDGRDRERNEKNWDSKQIKKDPRGAPDQHQG